MLKLIFPLLLLILSSCNFGNKQQQADPSTNTTPVPPGQTEDIVIGKTEDGVITESGIDKTAFDGGRITGYTKLLSGTWGKATDANAKLMVSNNKLSFVSDGNIEEEESFELIIKCQDDASCLANGQYIGGCCLITENNCYVVKRVDNKMLSLQKAGETKIVKYIKLED